VPLHFRRKRQRQDKRGKETLKNQAHDSVMSETGRRIGAAVQRRAHTKPAVLYARMSDGKVFSSLTSAICPRLNPRRDHLYPAVGASVDGTHVPSFRVDDMPYDEVKLSGIGREGVRYAIEDMTEIRLMVVREA
jgi:hypothetical protein